MNKSSESPRNLSLICALWIWLPPGTLIRVMLFLGCLVAAFAQSPATERKNVLLIIADDLNTRLGCYGATHIVSPNIDAMAQRSVRFDRAYCQYPSCGPSRASFLTGMRPDTTRVVNNRAHFRETLPSVITLPEWFRQHGYFTGRVGKVFHQDNPTHIGMQGLDDSRSWVQAIDPRGCDKDEESLLTVFTPKLPLPDRMSFYQSSRTGAQHTDGLVAKATSEMLQRHAGEPFFIAAGFYRPHIPYIAPKNFFELYSNRAPTLAEMPLDYRTRVPVAALESTPEWPNFGVTANQARQSILAYDACVSFVDQQIGQLLAALDQINLRRQTIVVVMGDHGYHLGEHGLWRKNSLFEESLRTPLLISSPDTPSGVCYQPIELLDLFPTLVELAGLPQPVGLEGISLVDSMRKPDQMSDRPARSQVSYTRFSGRSLRTSQWRYTQWGIDGVDGRELYDSRNDPSEMNNLASNPNYSAVMNRLKEQLEPPTKAAE